MEENKEKIINDALALIAEHEKHAERTRMLSLCPFVAGFVLIAVFAYGQIKANELRKISTEAFKFTYDTEVGRMINDIVDTKINLLRNELKLRNSFTGIIGGTIFGLGIGMLMTRKQKIKQIQVIKNIVYLIEKNS